MNNQLLKTFTFMLCFFSFNIFAQQGNISIGPDDPDASAALDVQSTTQGVLLPRMTTDQRDSISSPAEGLLVFDTDEGGFYFYQNSQWNDLSAGGGGVSNWTANGNDISNDNTGNVGIGTTDPKRKLHVYRGSAGTFASLPNTTAIFESPTHNYISMFNPANRESGLLFGDPNNSVSGAVLYNTGSRKGLQFRTNGNVPRMVVDSLGAVGIGTLTPQRRLHVSHGSAGTFASATHSAAVFESPTHIYISMFNPAYAESGLLFGSPGEPAAGGVVYNSVASPNGLDFRTNGNVARMLIDDVGHMRSIGSPTLGSITIAPNEPGTGGDAELYFTENKDGLFGMKFVYDGDDNQLSLVGYSNGTILGPHMLVNRSNGHMAIGTSEMVAGYQLSVGGRVACEEVFVELEANWPDYVFTPEYDLKSLSEVEAFITENGHLPGIPSAKEIDGKGIQVGEMNRLLVEKVEELTLHMIAQQKQIDEQAAIIQQLTNE